jgi:hypothetical protein
MRRIIGRFPYERVALVAADFPPSSGGFSAKRMEQAPPPKVVHDYGEWARGIQRVIASRPAHALCPMDEQLLSTKH